MRYTNKTQSGFTIVEIIVAVGLFSILMVIGIGAVLNANDSRRKSETQRAANDTLAFIMEDVSRNIRLGVGYQCGANLTANDCMSANRIRFDAPYLAGVNGLENARVVYQFIRPAGESMGYLEKSTDNGGTFFNITPAEVQFDIDASGFTVLGAQSSSDGDQRQPRVIIRLVGEVTDEVHDIRSPFAIQTTLSQRLLDN